MPFIHRLGPYESGLLLYLHQPNLAGELWNGTAFETYDADNWADYGLTVTEEGITGFYASEGYTPAAGAYPPPRVYQQLGATPSPSDPALSVSGGLVYWDGAAEVVIPSVSQIAAATGNAPEDPSLCRVTLTLQSLSQRKGPLSLRAKLVSPPDEIGGVYLDSDWQDVYARDDGTFVIDLARTATYRIRCDAVGLDAEYVIPDEDSVDLSELEAV